VQYVATAQEANSEEEVEVRIAGRTSSPSGKVVSIDHAAARDGVDILTNSWIF